MGPPIQVCMVSFMDKEGAFYPMNKENQPLVIDEPVKFEK